MLQTLSIKSLAFRVLREATAQKPPNTPCPTPAFQVGQTAGHSATSTEGVIPLQDVADLSLRESMEDSLKRFGQPHAHLFPLIGKKVWTPRGKGKLLSVFVTGCEVCPEGAQESFRVRPEEVRLIQ
jgi:hypothetical protein